MAKTPNPIDLTPYARSYGVPGAYTVITRTKQGWVASDISAWRLRTDGKWTASSWETDIYFPDERTAIATALSFPFNMKSARPVRPADIDPVDYVLVLQIGEGVIISMAGEFMPVPQPSWTVNAVKLDRVTHVLREDGTWVDNDTFWKSADLTPFAFPTPAAAVQAALAHPQKNGAA